MRLLLDTCAALWISAGAAIAKESIEAIEQAADDGDDLLVCPITAWEIGLLVARGRLTLPMSPLSWFDQLLRAPGLRMTELSVSVLIAASFLPGEPPRDPADRIIIATAREESLTIMTRDQHILDYGKIGHVLTLSC